MATRKRRKPRTGLVDRTSPNFELEAVLDQMPTEHLQCRDFNHSWRPSTVRRRPNGAYERELRCQRCRTYRVEYRNRYGHLESRRYDYADDYVIKGLGRVTGDERDHLVLKSMQAMVIEDLAEES